METYLSDLDRDIQENLKQMLAVVWTYSSNALEGNSLTLTETDFLVRERLTSSCKALMDYKQTEAHYLAVIFVRELAEGGGKLTGKDVLKLYGLIFPADETDREKTYDELACKINNIRIPKTKDEVVSVYFLIHKLLAEDKPFEIGNFLMARLLGNFPVMCAGFPPLFVEAEFRKKYVRELEKLTEIDLRKDTAEVVDFFGRCYETTYSYVESARKVQAERLLRRT